MNNLDALRQVLVGETLHALQFHDDLLLYNEVCGTLAGNSFALAALNGSSLIGVLS